MFISLFVQGKNLPHIQNVNSKYKIQITHISYLKCDMYLPTNKLISILSTVWSKSIVTFLSSSVLLEGCHLFYNIPCFHIFITHHVSC